MPLLWSLMKLVHFYAITFRPYGACELHQSLTYIDYSYTLFTNDDGYLPAPALVSSPKPLQQ
ncbi:hypothetical protein [Roseivirga pacifica]|uniref:hypothetical protein n=1 Tax=Roseivirga pacifica TaxID=1267423 RepID=UPI00227B6F48|nr:hypothetical protein [Roseivirga pacifica]